MFLMKFEFIGKAGVYAALSKVIENPRRRIKEGLDKWRLDISDEIGKGLSGKTLKKRTGDLFRSAASRSALTVVETGDFTFTIKFRKTLVSYAYAHEEGQTLTPTKSKFLAIPINSSLSNTRPRPLRSYQNTFIRKSKAGGEGYTVFEKLDSGKPVPIFILRKKIKLQKRPWFLEAVTRALPSLNTILEN